MKCFPTCNTLHSKKYEDSYFFIWLERKGHSESTHKMQHIRKHNAFLTKILHRSPHRKTCTLAQRATKARSLTIPQPRPAIIRPSLSSAHTIYSCHCSSTLKISERNGANWDRNVPESLAFHRSGVDVPTSSPVRSFTPRHDPHPNSAFCWKVQGLR